MRRFASSVATESVSTHAPSVVSEAHTELAEHRIAAIEIRRIEVPWPRQVGRNAKKGIRGHGPTPYVCVLRTDRGASGWGQIQGKRRSVERLDRKVLGVRLDRLIDPASGILDPDIQAIDIALHDLAGTILGQPVWKMLGANQSKLSKVYSGMIYFDDLEPAASPAGIDGILENCRWDYEYGYRQFKIKIGRGYKWMLPRAGLKRDIDVVRSVHRAFPDCDLLVDGNNGLNVDTCIQFLKGISDTPLIWIEEPFHENVTKWTRLTQWLLANGREGIFRADGETRPNFRVLETLEKTGTLNLRVDDICGLGFTNWRRLIPRLRSGGISASPHTWGTALKTVYTAHLAAALGNTPSIEGVTTMGGSIDFGDNRIVDARFQPSSAPGFGLTLPELPATRSR